MEISGNYSWIMILNKVGLYLGELRFMAWSKLQSYKYQFETWGHHMVDTPVLNWCMYCFPMWEKNKQKKHMDVYGEYYGIPMCNGIWNGIWWNTHYQHMYMEYDGIIHPNLTHFGPTELAMLVMDASELTYLSCTREARPREKNPLKSARGLSYFRPIYGYIYI